MQRLEKECGMTPDEADEVVLDELKDMDKIIRGLESLVSEYRSALVALVGESDKFKLAEMLGFLTQIMPEGTDKVAIQNAITLLIRTTPPAVGKETSGEG